MSNLDLKSLPKSPGVYQYFDAQGNIIYIGKSVNLFSRVHSYFNGKSKLNFAKKKMVEQIHEIKTIITQNETESLILETTLIKEHKPKYNILMKDDKNYLYLKITQGEFPQILKTRIKKKDGIYFGPYIHTGYVNNILQIIKKYFGYGVGEHHFFKTGSGYNLDKYLFSNHSKLENTKETYLQQIENIKNFIKGDFGEVIKDLEIKMKKFAAALQFEEAAKMKLQIEAIKSLVINQNVRDTVKGNYIIINFIEKFESFFIGMTKIIDSKIVEYNNFEIITKLEENKDEILETFIEKIYGENLENKINFIYLLPSKIENKSDFINGLKIEIPQIGPKLDLLKMTYKNIYEYAYKKHLASLSTKGFTKNTMQNLLKILGYKEINKSLLFECNDISHYAGSHTVASRSIIENGKSNTSKYKKFKIKTLEDGKIDDFGSMKEIMTRRLKEIEKTHFIPDLIIIDGGKGQLGSVMKIIDEFYKDQPIGNELQVVSIAKREEELFLPGEKKPIVLDKESLELRMIQKIRDEAHRFAITFNRDKRVKSMKTNILDSLPGFGPKTRKKILTKYGSINGLLGIDEIELSKILNKTQISTLENHGLI